MKGQRDRCGRFGPHGGKEFSAPVGQVLPTQTYQAQPIGCACCTQPRLQGRSPRTGRGQGRDVMSCPLSSFLPALPPQWLAEESLSKAASSPCLCFKPPFAQATEPAAGATVGGYSQIHSCPFSSSRGGTLTTSRAALGQPLILYVLSLSPLQSLRPLQAACA